MDQAPPDSPIAIRERVDGLELGVHDCRLRDRRQVRAVQVQGTEFVLIGRRPERRDVYLAQSIILLTHLTAIAAVEWSDLKVA